MEKYKFNALEKKIQKEIESNIKHNIKYEVSEIENISESLFAGLYEGFVIEDLDLSAREMLLPVNWKKMQLFIEEFGRAQATRLVSKVKTSFPHEAKQIVDECKNVLQELKSLEQERKEEDEEFEIDQKKRIEFFNSLTPAQRNSYMQFHPECNLRDFFRKQSAIKKKTSKRK